MHKNKYDDWERLKTNREESQETVKHKFWCSKCDRDLIGERGKCGYCGYSRKNGRPRKGWLRK